MHGMADRQSRSAQRSQWSVRIVRGVVGKHEAAALEETSPEQRLAMMWELVVQAWALADRPLPEYSRHETPVRVLRDGARS